MRVAYCFRITLENIHMRPLENEISRLPRVVAVAFLSHPSAVVRLADLLKNALPRLERLHTTGAIERGVGRGGGALPEKLRLFATKLLGRLFRCPWLVSFLAVSFLLGTGSKVASGVRD